MTGGARDTMMKTKKKQKVFVGLSGGVDSSVSAALLKDQGYDVTGVFIKTWHPDFLPCTWKEERLDAMRVAAHLDIPFKTYDFEKEYKEGVADYMISEYARGRTPNPDVMCNKEVKFGAFLKQALEDGADFIATGHYAQKKEENGEARLFAGVDQEKDQTYFLWTLGPHELSRTLFPVGGYEKSAVRKLAESYGLPTAQKKDSQGVCFLGQLNMSEFLKHYIEPQKGNVLGEDGEVIGEHDGATFFTFGQRHGFTITEKTDHEKPLYVVGKDLEENTITVSQNNEVVTTKQKQNNEIKLEDVNWTHKKAPSENQQLLARFRYRQELFSVNLLDVSMDTATFSFQDDGFSQNWAPGQSLVFYDDKECLGGGVLTR